MPIDRLIVVYIVQVLLAIILAFLFYYYSKQYKRVFLKRWSMSWLFYALAHSSSIGITLGGGIFRDSFSLISILATFLQLFYLVAGVLEFSKNRALKRDWLWIMILCFLSLTSFFLFYDGEEYANYRYVLRVGLKSLILGLVFLWATYRVIKSKNFQPGVGKRFLVFAFSIYAVQHLWYTSIVLRNVTGGSAAFPYATYGIIDLFTLAVVGLGMILWLLENERQNLEKANRELDLLLYSTSHDLRAPLVSVLGIVNLAKYDIKDELSMKYFGMIDQRVRKLDRTINDILLLYKSTNTAPVYQNINLRALVDDLVITLQEKNTTGDVSFITDFEEEEIYTDKKLLTTVLTNIFSNAIKYADYEKPKQLVNVSLKSAGNYTLTIEDNGQGIDPEYINKVFDMFYRANNGSEGTGLGLYIVKETVSRLGGEIKIASELDRGTIILIKLPKA